MISPNIVGLHGNTTLTPKLLQKLRKVLPKTARRLAIIKAALIYTQKFECKIMHWIED